MKKRSVLVRVFIILGLLLAVSLSALPASAASDGPLTIKRMKVSVWPEYDDSRILVTYQGEFNDGAAFPQPVKFPVPLGSEINQVCALQPPDDAHLCQLFETITEPGGLSVSYTLPIPTYYLEYYWDGVRGVPEKSFTFKYVSPYAADTLELEVQQPLKATDFKLDQPYASASSDSLGMKYYRYVLNDVAAGQVISFAASYTKTDSKPSVAKSQSSGVGGSAGGTGGSSAYTIMWIGAGLLAAVAIGFMVLRRKPVAAPARVAPMQSRKASRAERRAEARRAYRQETPAPARPQPASAPQAATARPQGGAAFCTKCGARLEGEARFCHACGTRARGAS